MKDFSDFDYCKLEEYICELKEKYPFLGISSIGESVLGRKLYCLRLGTGKKKFFFNGAHHALEWITSAFLMKFCGEYLSACSNNETIWNTSARRLWSEASICIVPMINPDGINLVINGISPNDPGAYRLIMQNNINADFSKTWQANYNGVDLNRNYDACFWESKKALAEAGYDRPGPTRFPGPYPESEPESRAVADFIRQNKFEIILCYHTQGELIFWNFLNLAPKGSREIGEKLSYVSGYSLEQAEGIASFGGLKDWYIKACNGFGYTIEAGKGVNPLPVSQLDKIYNDNLPLLITAIKIFL